MVVLCAHDPLTGEDRREVVVFVPPDAVLIVDSVFGMRPEYDEFWDFRIWIEVPQELAVARGIERYAQMEGRDEAERLHRDRYRVGEQIYVSEVAPHARADIVINNSPLRQPTTRMRSSRIEVILRAITSMRSVRAVEAGSGVGCLHDEIDSNASTSTQLILPDLKHHGLANPYISGKRRAAAARSSFASA